MIKSWEKAKNLIDTMPEPTAQEVAYVKGILSGVHETGGTSHTLKTYHHYFKVEGFDARFSWAACHICKQVRWKRFVLFNNESNSCYIRELFKKGKPVQEAKNYTDESYPPTLSA